jgi:hypothetical protein
MKSFTVMTTESSTAKWRSFETADEAIAYATELSARKDRFHYDYVVTEHRKGGSVTVGYFHNGQPESADAYDKYGRRVEKAVE